MTALARTPVPSPGDAVGALSDQARNTVKAADSYVRGQPWQAIGITAAVAVFIGFLLGRRGE